MPVRVAEAGDAKAIVDLIRLLAIYEKEESQVKVKKSGERRAKLQQKPVPLLCSCVLLYHRCCADAAAVLLIALEKMTEEQFRKDGFEEPKRFHCFVAENEAGEVVGYALYFFIYR